MYKEDEYLAHYGVLGMKWGVRRAQRKEPLKIKDKTESTSIKTKTGETIILDGEKTPGLAKFLAKYSSGIRKNLENTDSFLIKDSNGEEIGSMELFKESSNELNVVWVEVSDKHRGKGYATAAMIAAIKIAEKRKMHKVTLEVPGTSPDARHIYEKLGFKPVSTLGNVNDVWGGLTVMEKHLKKGG
jgi:GNAT superfamily N-acetyltransferase